MDELAKKRLEKKLKEVRSERYACQSIARKALPEERVSKCLRMLTSAEVELWQHRKTEKYFYNGLVVCGSVWHCPICAAKISERRRGELHQAFEMHQAEGNEVAMLTLTFSHKKHDDLEDILTRFSKAVHDFYQSRPIKDARKHTGLIGKIGALEVTYGFANGWHPHRHDVWFIQEQVNLESLEGELYKQWKKSLKKFNLTASREHGLKLQSGDKAQEYMSKHGTWSLEQEMSKAHVKKGKEGSLTPFDLLRAYRESEEGVYLKLFQEYAKFFKGKRQLQWSPGLKKYFIIEEKSDEVLATESQEESEFRGHITRDQWKLILRYEERTKVLEECETYGYEEGIKRIMDGISKFEMAIKKPKKIGSVCETEATN